MSTKVWIGTLHGGRLVDPADALVTYDDHGLTVGDGIFETLRLRGGVPFARTRHLRRLATSADRMHLPLPDAALLDEAIDAVAAAHGGDAYLRVTLTAGPGPLGSNREEVVPTLVVSVRPGDVRSDPTDVIVVPWVRNERGALVGVKSTSYAENVLALRAATEAGATEALFANGRDELCEGTGSNVFVGLDGRLVTPPLDSGCLAGVTRELLVDAGVGVEAPIPMTDLARADEIFLVSTGREVQPVHSIDGRVVPAHPGPLTLAARRVWLEQIAPLTDP